MDITIKSKDLTKFLKKLEDVDEINKFTQAVTRELAKALHEMLFQTTPVKTGNLCAAWGGKDNYSYTIKKRANGYSITLVNNAANEKNFRYGLSVNDGHWSKNQYGGPYGWVTGTFFVENAIDLTIPKIEQIVAKQLKKWWKGV